MSLNKVVLSGRLGKKPMVREFPNGGCVSNFSIAHDRYKGTGDNRTRVTDWHNCVARDRVAQYMCQEAMQGQKVVVMGRLVINSYRREDNQEEVKVVEIEVEDIELGRLPKATGEKST